MKFRAYIGVAGTSAFPFLWVEAGGGTGRERQTDCQRDFYVSRFIILGM